MKTSRQFTFSALFFLTGFFLVSCNSQSQEKQAEEQAAQLNNIYVKANPMQFDEKMNEENGEYLLIDVRTQAEYNSGAIASAQNFDLLNGEFEKQLEQWDRSTPIYVYCAKGGRSSRAANMLENRGFEKIIELKGGYTSWQNTMK